MRAGDSPIFRGLDAAQVDALVAEGTVRELAPGELLIERGSHGAELYFLIEGRLHVWVTEGGKERGLADLAAPAVVGEMEFLTGQERVASVRAAERAKVLALPFARLRARIEAGDPACLRVMFNIATVIADRLGKTVQMLGEVGATSAPHAEELAEFRRKLFSDWSL